MIGLSRDILNLIYFYEWKSGIGACHAKLNRLKIDSIKEISELWRCDINTDFKHACIETGNIIDSQVILLDYMQLFGDCCYCLIFCDLPSLDSNKWFNEYLECIDKIAQTGVFEDFPEPNFKWYPKY